MVLFFQLSIKLFQQIYLKIYLLINDQGLTPHSTDQAKMTSHKFVGRVDQLFKNLPKPLEWRSFYTHDLPLLLSTWNPGPPFVIKQLFRRSYFYLITNGRPVDPFNFMVYGA